MVTRTSDSLSRQKSANLAPANRVKMELAASMTMPRINVCVCPDLHLRTAKKVMQKIIYPYSYLKDRQTNTWKDNFSNATTIMLFEHRGSKSKGIRIDSPIGTDISLPSSYFFSLQAKFKRRIFHVLKSMQMSYKVGFTHFALSSVHETVGLRFYTNVTGDLEDVSKLYVFIHFCGQKLMSLSTSPFSISLLQISMNVMAVLACAANVTTRLEATRAAAPRDMRVSIAKSVRSPPSLGP